MPHIVVPGSWHNVTRGCVHSKLAAADLGELLRAFADAYPEAAYRLYSPTGAVLRYHVFFVDGQQVPRATPISEVRLAPGSTVRVVPPLAGG